MISTHSDICGERSIPRAKISGATAPISRDGTLSIFTPLIEADSAYTANEDDLSPAGLASLYRELSYNDLHFQNDLLGKVSDRNCELLLRHPHR